MLHAPAGILSRVLGLVPRVPHILLGAMVFAGVGLLTPGESGCKRQRGSQQYRRYLPFRCHVEKDSFWLRPVGPRSESPGQIIPDPDRPPVALRRIRDIYQFAIFADGFRFRITAPESPSTERSCMQTQLVLSAEGSCG